MKYIKTLLLLTLIAFVTPLQAEDRAHRCDSIDAEQYPKDYNDCLQSETMRGLREDSPNRRIPEDNEKVTNYPMDNASECSFSDDRTTITCPNGKVYSISSRQVDGARNLYGNYGGMPYQSGGLSLGAGTAFGY